jgi:flagellar biosynthesis chaperone FliJ
MADRERVRRIRAVRRLREIREKVDARAVGEARIALSSAEHRLSAAEGDALRLQREIAASMVQGARSTEAVEFHLAWVALRRRRLDAANAVARCRERLRNAIGLYLRSRIERKRMEAWETAAEANLRREEEHSAAVALDEIAVIRHGWRGEA